MQAAKSVPRPVRPRAPAAAASERAATVSKLRTAVTPVVRKRRPRHRSRTRQLHRQRAGSGRHELSPSQAPKYLRKPESFPGSTAPPLNSRTTRPPRVTRPRRRECRQRKFVRLVGSVSKGEHADAAEHLKTMADVQGPHYLRQLLPLKTPAEYDPAPSSSAQARRAVEAAKCLFATCRQKLNSACRSQDTRKFCSRALNRPTLQIRPSVPVARKTVLWKTHPLDLWSTTPPVSHGTCPRGFVNSPPVKMSC